MIARLIEEIRLEIVGRFNRGYRPILSANISLFYEISKINVQSFFLIQLFVQFFIILVQQSNVSSNEKYTYALQMEVIIKVRCKAKTRRIVKQLNRVTGNHPRGICIYTIDFSSKLEEVYSSEGKESIYRLPGERSWSSSLARVPL